jgi:hypothetical protein
MLDLRPTPLLVDFDRRAAPADPERENSQDPSQPIRPIISRTTAIAFIAKATGAYDAPVKTRGTGRSLTTIGLIFGRDSFM